MTILDFIVLVIVAAICGSIGQALSGYSLGGCLISAVVGFIGAFVGLWLARMLGLPEIFAVSIGGETFPIIWSIIGSAVLSLILGLLTRRRAWV
ncbi:MAG: GlsB/YeaQ/YmgE family stress response membrane protein [Chloroflexi bacterium]|nr:GlsB/YeaQ/YmgE family stress response membrane protein [Chloroflexota bacterium]